MRRGQFLNSSVLVFALLSAVVWWRPLFTDTALFSDLLYKLFFPNQEFLRRTILSGSFPLWNPHIYSGVPFAANMQSAVFYPFTYLILPMNYPRALAWGLWAHTALAGIFMFAFARSAGLSKKGALTAGIVFALNGNFLLRFIAPSHFFSYIWLPLILLAGVKKDLKLWQAWLLMSAALCLQLFAGHPQYLLYSLVACAVCVAVGPDRKRRLLVFAGGGAAFLALGAVQLYLTLGFLGQTVRAAGFGYEWSMSYSLVPRELLAMLALPQWNAYFTPHSGDPHIVGLYFGPITAIMAVVGLRARRSLWLPFAVLTVLGFALALGKYLPVYPWLYAHVAFFRMIRFPSQALYLSCIGMSVLAGLGVERLPESRSRWIPVLIAVDLILFSWRSAETIEPRVYAAVPATATALNHFPSARIMLTPRTRNNLTMTGTDRTSAWLRFKEVMFPNFPMAYGLDAADGQEELRYARYEEVLDRIDQNPLSAWIDVVGVTHVLTRWNLPAKFKMVSKGMPNVYVNPAALPRAYVTHDAVQVPDDKVLDYVEHLGSAALPRRIVTPEPATTDSVKCSSQGSARIVENASQRVQIEADTPCPGWLVLADAYDPGWRARLNGASEEIHRVNFVQRAVRIPAGRSSIEFDYQPRFLAAAAAVSALAWLFALGLFARWALTSARRA